MRWHKTIRYKIISHKGLRRERGKQLDDAGITHDLGKIEHGCGNLVYFEKNCDGI